MLIDATDMPQIPRGHGPMGPMGPPWLFRGFGEVGLCPRRSGQ